MRDGREEKPARHKVRNEVQKTKKKIGARRKN